VPIVHGCNQHHNNRACFIMCLRIFRAKFTFRCRFGRSDAPAITLFVGSALKVGLFTSNKITAPFAATTAPIKDEGAL
jgi:hypothetical protein